MGGRVDGRVGGWVGVGGGQWWGVAGVWVSGAFGHTCIGRRVAEAFLTGHFTYTSGSVDQGPSALMQLGVDLQF